MTAQMHHWDINPVQFNQIIKALKKIIVENNNAGKRTFVYFQYGGHGFVDSEG